MQIKKQKLELNMGQQFSLVTQLCLTLCDPMDYSTTGFPDHHQLPKLTQTHVHRVSDAIQPSHPLSAHNCIYASNFDEILSGNLKSRVKILCAK